MFSRNRLFGSDFPFRRPESRRPLEALVHSRGSLGSPVTNMIGLFEQIDRDANARNKDAQEILAFLQELFGDRLSAKYTCLADIDMALDGRLDVMIVAEEYDKILESIRQLAE